MNRFIISIFAGILLSGCTIYRSEGRKQFESEAPVKVSATASSAFQLQSCKQQGRLETWLSEEFPSQSYELVVTEPDLEIWRTHRGSTVEVKALQKSENGTQTCTYTFSSDEVWTVYKNQFIQELENNMMTVE